VLRAHRQFDAKRTEHIRIFASKAGGGACDAAVAFGACLIEKHVTLDRADGGVDSAFSLEPAELKALRIESERAWQALGTTHIGPTEAEKESLRLEIRG